MKKRAVKITLEFLFFAIVLGAALYVVFHGQDMGEMQATLQKLTGFSLVLAALLAVLYVCCEGFMIWFMLAYKKGLKSLPRCIAYAFVNFFYSGITPSASGGQPMQLYYLKRDGYSISKSCAVLTVIAAFNKLVLAAGGILMLIFWGKNIFHVFGESIGIYFLGLAVLIIWVIVLNVLVLAPGLFEKMASSIAKLLQKIHILKPNEERKDKIIHFFDGYRDVKTVIMKDWIKVTWIAVISVIQRILLVAITCVVYKGFGLKGTGLFRIFLLQLGVMVAVDMLPLPGAQGISEVMYTTVFSGVMGSVYLKPSVVAARLSGFYLPLFIGLVTVIVLQIFKKKKDREDGRVI